MKSGGKREEGSRKRRRKERERRKKGREKFLLYINRIISEYPQKRNTHPYLVVYSKSLSGTEQLSNLFSPAPSHVAVTKPKE